MTGPHDGDHRRREREPSLGAFLTGMPARFETGHRQSAPERRRRRAPTTRPAGPRRIERLSLLGEHDLAAHRVRADRRIELDAVTAWSTACLRRSRRRPPPPRSPRRDGARLTVSRADRRAPRAARRRASSKSGSRASSRTAACGTPGHLYFTLKDARAQIKGVMFRSALRCCASSPRTALRVVARGRVSVYDPKGEYQLVCEHLEPEGLGALQLAFEQLQARLAAEGLFDDGAQAAAAGAAPQDRRRHLARRRGRARHHPRAAPPLSERAPRHRARRACRARARRSTSRAALRQIAPRRRASTS